MARLSQYLFIGKDIDSVDITGGLIDGVTIGSRTVVPSANITSLSSGTINATDLTLTGTLNVQTINTDSGIAVTGGTTDQLLRGDGSLAALQSAEVTQFQGDLTIAESQISDLKPYLLDAPIDGNQYSRLDGNWAITQQTIPISDTPPVDPPNGQLWYDSSEGVPYIYYNDGDSTQWVELNGAPSVVQSGISTGKAIAMAIVFG